MLTSKKRNSFYLFLVIALGFVCFNLSWPNPFNQGAGFLNEKIRNLMGQGTPLQIPKFPEKDFKLGLDLRGGSRLIYEADLSKVEKDAQDQAMQGLRDVIERRIDLFGVAEPLVNVQQAGGVYRLNVELAGVMDVQKAIEMLGKTPYLEFREQKSQEELDKIQAKKDEIAGKTEEEYKQIQDWQLAFEEPFEPTKLTGQYLKKATLVFDQNTYQAEVALEFNDEGAKIFEEITTRNVGKQLAIYIDNSIISAPRVNEPISGGKAQITGQFTTEEAKELARNLNAGALPVPILLISQNTIGPTLGFESLQKSLKAGIWGFLAVVLFILLVFRFSGLWAGLALLIYCGILISLLKLIPVTLTLAGIGGAILSVGMAVDANVLIFSRMKEERQKGEPFSRALEIGYQRAWPSIRDSNITTILIALIMFAFGTSFVKGFALTLSIGVLVSMFSALFVTKTFLRTFVGTRLENIKWLWG